VWDELESTYKREGNIKSQFYDDRWERKKKKKKKKKR